jgi:hypothetical protein
MLLVFILFLQIKSVVMNRRASSIAASDLAFEAQILANLQHKNIISLRGISSGDLYESLNKGDFCILLVDTLDVRLLRWNKRKFPFLPPSKPSIKDRLQDVAVGKADGGLHAKQLIFLYDMNMVSYLFDLRSLFLTSDSQHVFRVLNLANVGFVLYTTAGLNCPPRDVKYCLNGTNIIAIIF